MLNMKKIFNEKFGIKFMGVMLGMMLAVPAFASISVAPTRLEINANKIKQNYYTTAIEIRGDNDKPIRFKAYTAYFKVNEKSEVVDINDPTDPHNISKKIRFVPSEFTVSPGRSQKLRVNITGIKNLPEGENRAILYIEDVNPKEFNIPTPVEGIGAQLIVKSRMGIPIYIDNGKFNKTADIESFNVVNEKGVLYSKMKVVSTGNSKVRYMAKAQIVQGDKLIDEYDLFGRAVGDNNFYLDKTKVKLDKIKDSGEYTLRLNLSYFDEKGKRKYITRETKFNVVGKI